MLEKIKFICANHLCYSCPFFDSEETDCIFRNNPNEWDIAEIEKRMGGTEND